MYNFIQKFIVEGKKDKLIQLTLPYDREDLNPVKSKETIDYALEDLSGIPGLEIPLPEQNTSMSTATLTSFEIGN